MLPSHSIFSALIIEVDDGNCKKEQRDQELGFQRLHIQKPL